MNAHDLTAIQHLQRQAASLLLYQATLRSPVGSAFSTLLQALYQYHSTNGEAERYATSLQCLQAYGEWFQALAVQQQSWPEYLITQILQADNPFSQAAQRGDWQQLPHALTQAARQDLHQLQALYQCGSEQLSHWVQTATGIEVAPTIWSTEVETVSPAWVENLDWADAAPALAAYYRQFGSGIFATYRAFRWQSGELLGIRYPDPIQLSQLVGYEIPREDLLKNTQLLLAGYPALNVLLYGSRGSGKSSLVKALVNEYGDRGLRLIEVPKAELQALSAIVERLRDLPQKFIIFVDDLSFEEDNDAFKSLKVVLEGNITARPQNVVVYATSNRRHLIREFFGDRPRPSDADEINAWDTVQEKLSFSDRFGLTLTFEPADQRTYLAIVQHLAAQAEIPLTSEELEYRALQWATRHNGRSGRTARQFVDWLRGELALTS